MRRSLDAIGQGEDPERTIVQRLVSSGHESMPVKLRRFDIENFRQLRSIRNGIYLGATAQYIHAAKANTSSLITFRAVEGGLS